MNKKTHLFQSLCVLCLLLFSLTWKTQGHTTLNFDGTDDYVPTDYPGVLGSNARTVEAWVKANNLSEWEGLVQVTNPEANCDAPTNIAITNIDNDKARANWPANGQDTWTLKYGESGFDVLTDGTAIDADAGDTPIEGLNPNTAYDVYVQADCGTDGLSDWSAVKTFTTLENELCPDPSEFALSNATATTVDATWTENGNTTTWYLRYGTQGFDPTAEGTYHDDQDGETGTTVEGLMPETTYDVYIEAYCGSGKFSDWVGPVQVTTLEACPAPINISVTDIDFDRANVAWQEAGNAQAWQVIYGPSGFDTSSQEGTIVEADDPVEGVMLTNLDNGTGYDVYVRAVCDGEDNSDWTGPKPFTTPENEICPDPSEFALSNATATTVDATWTENGEAENWGLRFGETGFDPANGGTDYFDTDGQAGTTVDGLTPETTYEVYLVSLCGFGNRSEWIGPVQVTTLEACPAPINISVTDIDFDRANVAWQEAGNAQAWQVIYGPSGFDTSSQEGTIVEADDPVEGVMLTNLDNGTGYDVYVRAVCDGEDNSDWTGPKPFTTPENEICPDPSEFALSNATATTVDATWTENGEAENWGLRFGETGFDPANGGTDYFDTDGQAGTTVDGLTPETTYEVYLVSLCGFGNRSEWIGPVQVTTLEACPAPINISVTDIDFDRANVAWQEAGNAQAWQVIYGPSGFDISSQEGTVIGADDPVEGVMLTNLDNGTGYDVYVRAVCNGVDNSDWTGPKPFTTPENEICPDPSDFVLNNATAYSVDADWTENGEAENWGLRFGETGFDPANGGTDYFDTDGQAGTTVDGLTPETTYEVYLVSLCGFGNRSEWIGPVQVTTLHECPDPTNISVTDIDVDTAMVGWTENGTAEAWQVLYGPTGFDVENEGNLLQDNDGDLGVTITGLTNSTGYDVYVRSVCGTGYFSGWTGPKPFTTTDEEVCPDPTGFYAMGVTSDSATFDWMENGSSQSWALKFGEPGFNPENEGTIYGSDQVGTTVDGLTPETTYEVYLVSLCGFGNLSEWVGPVQITTLSDCPAPTNISVTDIDVDTAMVGWTENGTAEAWQVLYGPTGFDVENEGNLVQDNDGNLGVTLNGLTNGTGYDVYVRANCGNGNLSEWTGPKPFTTTDEEVCPDPTGFYAMGVTSDSATFDWMENGNSQSWALKLGDPGFNPVNEGTIYGSDQVGTTVDGLTPETTYEVYLVSLCGFGNRSEWIGPVQITTLSDCPAPTNISVTDIDVDTAMIGWTENGTAEAWQVLYGPTGFDVENEGNLVQDNDGNLGVTLNGLTNGTGYDVYVRANCGNGNLSEWTGPKPFTTTDEEVCPDPTGFYAMGVTSDSATFDWMENGNSQSWALKLGDPGFNPVNEGTIYGSDQVGTTVDGLTPETTYEVYLVSLCGFGNRSEWIGPVQITTLSVCETPTEVTVMPLPESEAEVSWTENGNATLWEVQYGTAGFDPTMEGVTVTVNTNTLVITGLTEGADYDVYVRAICGGDNASEWSELSQFTTLSLVSESFKSFTYYPNPVKNVLTLNANYTIEQITVYNLLGQKVMVKNPNALEHNLDMSQLQSGAYLMQVQVNGAAKTFRVIKQ